MFFINCFFKVPSNNGISIYYSKEKNCIIFCNKNKTKILKLSSFFEIIFFKNSIFVLINFLNKFSNIQKKKFYKIKKAINLFFKNFLTEIQGNYYKKLLLKGVGFKVFSTQYNNILLFKLGYTHSIFFKLNFNFFIYKNIKLFIVHDVYKDLTTVSSLIKLIKWPDPYKGKGVLFSNEKINLKVSKKI